MDFHSLPRRELQALCKRNRIPANTTNVAMADALHYLKLEGKLIEFAQETVQESPKNVLAGSVRKASVRRPAAPSAGASVEPKEQLASPLPRARRVTVKASEIRRLVSEGEGEEEEEKKEGLTEMTTPVSVVKRSTAKKLAARNTGRGAGKKENAETVDEGPLEAAKTPATRNGRRTAPRRGSETPAMAEQEGQDAVFSPRISTRRTRQSSKSTAVVDLTASTVRRSTRIRARTSAPEMEDLVPEPEQVAEGTEIKDSSEKLYLETGNVSDLKETEGVESTGNNYEKDCDSVVADVVGVVKEDGAPAETTEIDDSSEDETVAQKEVEQGVQINIPTERGDGADEELSDLQEEIGGSDEKLSDLQEEVGESDEQDSDGVFENTILPQRQHATVAKGMIQEAEGFDVNPIVKVVVCSEVDAKEGSTQECEDCDDDSSGVFENASVTQHQLSTDAQEGMTQEIEDCEEDSNGVLENTILPQHQLANDAKEDGMIQEAEGFDQQLVEVEDCSEVEQETNQAGTAASAEVEGLQKLASADADWQSENEEDEMRTLPDSHMVTEELQVSPAESQASAIPEAIESDTSSPEKVAVGDAIITTSESEAVVKNNSSADFSGCGEMVENDAEKESKKNLDLDYNLMSMRKLRTIYKEKVIEKKAEGRRRLPFAEINDDQLGEYIDT